MRLPGSLALMNPYRKELHPDNEFQILVIAFFIKKVILKTFEQLRAQEKSKFCRHEFMHVLLVA